MAVAAVVVSADQTAAAARTAAEKAAVRSLSQLAGSVCSWA
jgi:hypothetical protein